jgi:hypothetical protein
MSESEEDFVFFEVRRKIWDMDPAHRGQELEYNGVQPTDKELKDWLNKIGTDQLKEVGLDGEKYKQPEYDPSSILKILEAKNEQSLSDNPALEEAYNSISEFIFTARGELNEAEGDSIKQTAIICKAMLSIKEISNPSLREDLEKAERNPLYAQFRAKISEWEKSHNLENQEPVYPIVSKQAGDDSKPDEREIRGWLESVGLYEGDLENFASEDIDGLFDAVAGKSQKDIDPKTKKKRYGEESDKKEIGTFKYKVRMFCKTYEDPELRQAIKDIEKQVEAAVQLETDKVAKLIKICEGMLAIRAAIDKHNNLELLQQPEQDHANVVADLEKRIQKENENTNSSAGDSPRNKTLETIDEIYGWLEIIGYPREEIEPKVKKKASMSFAKIKGIENKEQHLLMILSIVKGIYLERLKVLEIKNPVLRSPLEQELKEVEQKLSSFQANNSRDVRTKIAIICNSILNVKSIITKFLASVKSMRKSSKGKSLFIETGSSSNSHSSDNDLSNHSPSVDEKQLGNKTPDQNKPRNV